MKELSFIKEINLKNKNKWIDFLKYHPKANAFQTFEMVKFLSAQKNNQSFGFFLESPSGECLCACVGSTIHNGNFLTKFFTSRTIIYGGPLVAENSKYSKEYLTEFFIKKIHKELCSKSIYIEIRNLVEDFSLNSVLEKQNFRYIPYLNYLITLDTEDQVMSRFKSETRRQLRKALKQDFDISMRKSQENVEGIHNVLHQVYKQRVKKPIPTSKYFENLMSSQNSSLIAIKHKGKFVGGGFFLNDENTVYNWYRGGINNEQIKYITLIIDWYLIKFAIEKGIQIFDFMGAGIKGEHYGVRRYKSHFGGKLIENGRLLYVCKPIIYNIGRKAIKFIGGKLS